MARFILVMDEGTTKRWERRPVTLSPSLRSRVNSAKGLARRAQRSFAALRMTARTPLKSAQVLSPNVWGTTSARAILWEQA